MPSARGVAVRERCGEALNEVSRRVEPRRGSDANVLWASCRQQCACATGNADSVRCNALNITSTDATNTWIVCLAARSHAVSEVAHAGLQSQPAIGLSAS